jgi:hypothetical protein
VSGFITLFGAHLSAPLEVHEITGGEGGAEVVHAVWI